MTRGVAGTSEGLIRGDDRPEKERHRRCQGGGNLLRASFDSLSIFDFVARQINTTPSLIIGWAIRLLYFARFKLGSPIAPKLHPTSTLITESYRSWNAATLPTLPTLPLATYAKLKRQPRVIIQRTYLPSRRDGVIAVVFILFYFIVFLLLIHLLFPPLSNFDLSAMYDITSKS